MNARARVNPVALVGAVVGGLALLELPLFSPGWLLFKANRIVQGDAYGAFGLSPLWAWVLLACWLLTGGVALIKTPARPWLVSGLAAAALVVALLSVSQGTSALLQDAARSARVSLLGGVWLTLLAYYVCLFGALNEARGKLWTRASMVAPGLLVAVALVATGTLGELGLARELASQGGDFRAELLRHLALSGTSVLLASLIGLPAAIWAARRDEVASIVLPTASLLQTLPSLALFGIMLGPLARLGQGLTVGGAALVVVLGSVPALALGLALWRWGEGLGARGRGAVTILILVLALVPVSLLTVILAVVLNEVIVALFSLDWQLNLWQGFDAPLSTLGVRGIGTAPALIALTLYALLPIVRNAYTGIKEVPRAAVEAGRGMGMSTGQILRRVELPLALPLIVEGLRASAVLTIGITTVAYLIGAGGLGTFIQRGIDQVVPDLILLGAIPIILLALLVDGLLRLAGIFLTPRGLRG